MRADKAEKRCNNSGIGIVLSGGGARAAYQAGALKALGNYLDSQREEINVVVGSSIGAINGLLFSAALKGGFSATNDALKELWVNRNFRNSFSGTPTVAFMRAIRMAVLQYLEPGPYKTSRSLFNPHPLSADLDRLIIEYGGLAPEKRASHLHSIAVMTTVEGKKRHPLLILSSSRDIQCARMEGADFDISFVSELNAKHGFASAALPHVLPPVELDTEKGLVTLVDGGISQNIPVDPAVRLGADRVVTIDISGRCWWFEHFGDPLDTRPEWEVAAKEESFCMRPAQNLIIRNQKPFGPVLKEAVGNNRKRFIAALGPTWPVFRVLKNRLGTDLAYEVMSYIALDNEYLTALIEIGYNEADAKIKDYIKRKACQKEGLFKELKKLYQKAIKRPAGLFD